MTCDSFCIRIVCIKPASLGPRGAGGGEGRVGGVHTPGRYRASNAQTKPGLCSLNGARIGVNAFVAEVVTTKRGVGGKGSSAV